MYNHNENSDANDMGYNLSYKEYNGQLFQLDVTRLHYTRASMCAWMYIRK